VFSPDLVFMPAVFRSDIEDKPLPPRTLRADEVKPSRGRLRKFHAALNGELA
jgi:hypothetical protein